MRVVAIRHLPQAPNWVVPGPSLTRRGLVLTTTTVGIFLAGIGVAYACVVAQGWQQVNNGPKVVGNPGDGSAFMQWCDEDSGAGESQPYDAVDVVPGDTVTVSVGSTTDCASGLAGGSTLGVQDGDNELPPGLYVVSFTNHAFDGSGGYVDDDLNQDCMAVPPFAAAGVAENNFSVVGALVVDQNGSGSGQAIIPPHAHASASAEAAGLCVTQAAGAYAGVPLLGGDLNGLLDQSGDRANGVNDPKDQRDKGGPPIGNFVPVNVTQDGPLATHSGSH